MSVLSVKDLEKRYGDLQAVDKISFHVEENEIYALIGPNGAGKTSTLRVIATILQPDGGSLVFNGLEYGRDDKKVRENISYLPEEAGAYKNLTGIDYLKFMAGMFSENKQQSMDYFNQGVQISRLDERLKHKISTYSKGMVRKLLLARTVMIKPSLAILDEPTSGLDVQNAFEIRKIIKDLKEKGMSVLLSSHNMLEIEFLSDRVGIIYKGKILEEGTPAQLKEKYNAENLEEVFMEVIK